MLIEAILGNEYLGEEEVLLNTDYIEHIRMIGDDVIVSTTRYAYRTGISIERLKQIMGHNKHTEAREG